MLASSAVDGFNYKSYLKMKTDIDEFEMVKAKRYREENIEPFLQDKLSYEETEDDETTNWFRNNIVSSGTSSNPDLPGRFMTLLLIIFCIGIALLDLGSTRYEITLKILAFLFALSTMGIFYSIFTNIVSKSNFYFKRWAHFILLIIFPIMIYLCISIYFL